MVSVTILNDRVVIEVEGLHQLWALRSRLDRWGAAQFRPFALPIEGHRRGAIGLDLRELGHARILR